MGRTVAFGATSAGSNPALPVGILAGGEPEIPGSIPGPAGKFLIIISYLIFDIILPN